MKWVKLELRCATHIWAFLKDNTVLQDKTGVKPGLGAQVYGRRQDDSQDRNMNAYNAFSFSGPRCYEAPQSSLRRPSRSATARCQAKVELFK